MAEEFTFQNLKVGNEQDKNRESTLRFRMSPTHVSYANTLRRLCVAHVETVAFRANILEDDVRDGERILQKKGSTSDVEVISNTTPMTNEMLAHRIGLLPIHVDPVKWKEEKGQENYVFELDVTNTNADVLHVTTDDFKVLEKTADGETTKSAAEYFPKPSGYPCLIATLKPFIQGIQTDKEVIHLRARASVGIGRENAQFIPVSRATYSYTRIAPDVPRDGLRENPEVLAAYDKWLGEKNTNRDALQKGDEESKAKEVAMWNEFLTTPIQRCYIVDENTGEPKSFDFVIESVNTALPPQVIVQRALEAGVAMCAKYEAGVLGSNLVPVQLADTRFLAFDFHFQNEDHTLGNLVQTYIEQVMMDESEYGISFVGYDIPHPLRDEMVLRVGLTSEAGQQSDTIAIVEKAMTGCKTMFDKLLKEWNIQAGFAKPSSAAADTNVPLSGGVKVIGKRTIKRPAA